MKKSAVYTRTGDTGTTTLAGGKRVAKDHPRVETYGSIDELNAHVGLLATSMRNHSQHATLETIMNNLFTIGSYFACEDAVCMVPDCAAEQLEKEIDTIDSLLTPIHAFLLPGSNEASARANMCRTVCRRIERRIVALAAETEIPQQIYTYINRLSDYFFVLSRLLDNGAEKKWEKCWK